MRNLAALVVCGLAASALAISASTARSGPVSAGTQTSVWHDGVSTPSDQRQLAFAVRGRIAATHAEPGDRVEAGQLLVEMDSAVQQRVIEAARNRATDRTDIEAAEKTLELRTVDFEKMQEAFQQDSASDADLRTRRLQRDLAQIELDSTNRRFNEANVVLQRELARLEEMRIVSPVAGTIISVNRKPGESVDELTGVVTLVVTDPLWVEVSVPSDLARRLKPGDSGRVRWPQLADEDESLGRVLFVSPVSDPGSRKTLVRLEIDNPGELPAGLHASVSFEGDRGVSAGYPSDLPDREVSRAERGPASAAAARSGSEP